MIQQLLDRSEIRLSQVRGLFKGVTKVASLSHQQASRRHFDMGDVLVKYLISTKIGQFKQTVWIFW